MAVYSYHNATAKDRYSIFDIVDENEEKDPLNEQYGRKKKNMTWVVMSEERM